MSTMPALSSVVCFKKYTLSKWEVRSLSNNSWLLDPLSLPCFRKYYLLYWSPKHFFKKISYGTLEHHGVEYVVCYHKVTVDACKHARQVALSFRQPQPEYDLPPIVLVGVASK